MDDEGKVLEEWPIYKCPVALRKAVNVLGAYFETNQATVLVAGVIKLADHTELSQAIDLDELSKLLPPCFPLRRGE